MRSDEILQQMTPKEKLRLCEGADDWHTMAFEKYGVPQAMMSDGPHGLRKKQKGSGININASVPATCFPASAATACSWDPALIASVAQAIGEEARAEGVSLILGPGLNIKRDPLCGRNFEYFSEDPYLTGQLGAAYVNGLQSTGVGACIKHFAANSQEYKRFSSDSVMDERTLREIYLPAFENAVKQARPWAVMCSYNRINGTHASSSKTLLTDILRGEWGFDGFVVTDWGAMESRVASFQAGCDLNMPGGSRYQQAKALRALKDGSLSMQDVDTSCARILDYVRKAQAVTPQPYDPDAHHALARRAAAESMVLLKNDGALPLRGSFALIGHMAKEMRFQGSGSSHINPLRVVNPADCMDAPYAEGCLADGSTTDELLAEAAALAARVDTPVVFAGLPDSYESEGFDRAHMRLPEGHDRLIRAAAAANPNTVVVLLCGSPVEVPWLSQVNALLYAALPGQAGGEAIRDVLTGAVNPGGKLSETWPLRYEDTATAGFYAKRDAEYREGVLVGYRFYERAGKSVRFPFGFGLSNTQFAYSDLRVDGSTIRVRVTNTGSVPGAEVVQLYIRAPKGGLLRPVRELKGFRKFFLQPGETGEAVFPLDERSFAIWQDGWVVPGGTYAAEVGGLTVEIQKSGPALPIPAWQKGTWYEKLRGVPAHVEWEAMLGRRFQSVEPQKGQYTMDSTVLEMKERSWIMRRVYHLTVRVLASGFGGKRDLSDPAYRMMVTTGTDCALRAMAINAHLHESFFEGLLAWANGHFFRGIGKMLRR